MKRTLLLAAVAAVSAVIWVSLMPAPPVVQPLPFDHAKHAEVRCAACHRGAERAARAGIPDAETCQKCHATPPRAVEQVLTAGASWPSWVRVTHLPDHVMFSHRRHVDVARLDCASCHGDLRARQAALTSAPLRMDMDACLSCHKTEGAADDCVACHR